MKEKRKKKKKKRERDSFLKNKKKIIYIFILYISIKEHIHTRKVVEIQKIYSSNIKGRRNILLTLQYHHAHTHTYILLSSTHIK